MERLLRDEIARYIIEKDVLSEYNMMSWKINLASQSCSSSWELDRGDRVELRSLDFMKAFDYGNQRLLIRKISFFGVTPTITWWIGAFLSRRLFHVGVDSSISSPALLTSDILRCSVLQPLLFAIYVNDLTVKLHSPCYIFPDDLKLVSNPGERQLQDDWNRLYQ